MDQEPIQCMVCDGLIPGMTGKCPKCGSRYRRGELITEGKVQPKRRVAVAKAEPKPIDFDKLPWLSYQNAATRDAAIDAMYAFYRAHPAKWQRRDPVELYEVYRAENEGGAGIWCLYVRKRNGA